MAQKTLQLKRLGGFLSLTCAALLAACDSSSTAPDERLTIANPATGDSALAISAPERIRSTQAIDPAAVGATVQIDGAEFELQRNAAGQYVGQIVVPAQSSFDITVQFFEDFQGQRLILASLDQPVTTESQDVTVSLQNSDYQFDAFDFDGDSVSNIVERENDSDPLDPAALPSLSMIDVSAAVPLSAVNAGFTNFDFEVTVADASRTQGAEQGTFNQTFTVARQDAIAVSVRLIERQTGQQLVVGNQTRVLTGVGATASIVFNSIDYDISFDQDSDGVSNLDELIAGSNPLGVDSNEVPFTITFDVPTEIANPASVFAVALVAGQPVDLTRNSSTYVGDASAEDGSEILLEVAINDTFDGQVLPLASFSAQVQATDGATFVLQDFSLQFDADGDGIPNFQELADSTDPFNPPAEECTVESENITLSLVEDVFLNNRVIVNGTVLRVDDTRRVSLLRYQTNQSLEDITSAALSLSVSTDDGQGLIAVSILPGFALPDSGVLTLPDPGPAIGSLDEVWVSGERYNFALDATAISNDFTLVLTQETGSGSADVSFQSSESPDGPALTAVVEVCR